MNLIPFSLLPLRIKLSPNIILPKPLKGSAGPNHSIIFRGLTFSVESLCSAKYFILPILG